jgi:hypothetical protein
MRALAGLVCLVSAVNIQALRADDGEVATRVLSDDLCAARMMVYAEITDTSARGVNNAELWLLDSWKATDEPRREPTAVRLGTTAFNGIVAGSLCLMKSEEYSRWKPGASVRFTLYALRDGYGFAPVVHEVSTEELLKDANLLGGVPGQPNEWKNKPRQGAYVLEIQVQLTPVVR